MTLNNIHLKLVVKNLDDGRYSGNVMVFNSDLAYLDSYELGDFQTRSELMETFESFQHSFYEVFGYIFLTEIVMKGGLDVGTA